MRRRLASAGGRDPHAQVICERLALPTTCAYNLATNERQTLHAAKVAFPADCRLTRNPSGPRWLRSMTSKRGARKNPSVTIGTRTHGRIEHARGSSTRMHASRPRYTLWRTRSRGRASIEAPKVRRRR